MKNSKYIKVSVSDRLPDNDGDYSTDQGNLSFKVKTKDWYYAGWRHNHKVEFWLQEVPDYEDEMKGIIENFMKNKIEMLKALDFSNNLAEDYEWLFEDAEELLTKLKTESCEK